MSVELFLSLLLGFSTITSLITEAIKKIIKNSDFPVDMIVLCVSILVGGVGSMIYYMIMNIPVDGMNVTYCALMAIATWLSSMVGYDKVVEAIKQLKGC